MYDILLRAHSGLRWVVLILLVATVIMSIHALFTNKEFSSGDKKVALFTLIFTHIQLVLGLILYFISPWVKAAMADMGAAMKDPQLRFWVVEHFALMLIAIILITIGYSSSKRAKSNLKKYRRLGIFYAIGLVLILVAIPWPFREAIGRGWF
jgi:hypothetical protein